MSYTFTLPEAGPGQIFITSEALKQPILVGSGDVKDEFASKLQGPFSQFIG